VVATFADTLSAQIRGNPAFWTDFRSMCSFALREVVKPRVDVGTTGVSEEVLGRLLETASVFAQSTSDEDRGLAQQIAYYATVIDKDDAVASVARGIFTDIGNHPGALRLPQGLRDGALPFGEYLRTHLLRALNEVKVGGRAFAFTDFQRNVWDRLGQSQVTAISAPTSAGKSFVVLEYLSRIALESSAFRAVYVAPTRALLSEIQEKLTKRIGESDEAVRISTVPSEGNDAASKHIYVLTQERLQVLLAESSVCFDLVIVDEVQTIADESRGMILQDCLEEIRDRSPSTRFLFLAPGAQGFELLGETLDVPPVNVESTTLSPVVQNRIVVEPVKGYERRLSLRLLGEKAPVEIATFEARRGFGDARTRLAAVALELGAQGGSLVYGTGPADAERVAGQIATDCVELKSKELKELAAFIRKHVHKRYSLASHVTRGVGFHYGKMPSLLRESLEDAFRRGTLKYLVCTTTLFQGINLPARSVFIDTPTRGRGDSLDAAALWNFAGRAGRLGHDIVGNVFLVDYDHWESKPLDNRVAFRISPAFRRTVCERFDAVVERLGGAEPQSRPFQSDDAAVTSAAGLLIARAAKGSINQFVERSVGRQLSVEGKSTLIEAALSAHQRLGLPEGVLERNWTVNPFGQARLYDRFKSLLQEGRVEELIPPHPSGNVYSTYVQVFTRINKYILGLRTSNYARYVTSMALGWMRGKSYPQLISEKLRRDGNEGAENVDTTVRNIFDFVEDKLRFEYVQLGRAYIDLLRHALERTGHSDSIVAIYDFPMALELGVSSIAGQAFIEVGLSRIAAAELEKLIPDSSPTTSRVREWLHGVDLGALGVSRVIKDELMKKGLVHTAGD